MSDLLSIVIPVFNERNTVGEVVRRVRETSLPEGFERELIVVDVGSRDDTAKVLNGIDDSTVRIIHHDHNRGQGAAVRTALEYVRGHIVLVQDADLEYDPDDIHELIKPIVAGRADVVLGNRFRTARPVMPLTSVVLDRTVSLAACALFNTTLSDVECAYKAFNAEVLKSVEIEANDFSYGPEVIAKLLRLDARFVEVPVRYTGRRTGGKFAAMDRWRAVQALTYNRFRPARRLQVK